MSARILQGPEFRFPPDEGTLGQFFFNYAEKHNDRICQVDGTADKTETFASAKLRSTRVAIEMMKRGLTSDDVVTFCCGNTIDNTIPMLAAFYLGAKVSNLDKSLSVRHTQHLLGLVTPKMIFVEESAISLIEESLSGTGLKSEIVVFGTSDKYSTFSDFVNPAENEDEFRPLEADPDDIALMLFSSGTTGLPKAISHSSRSFLWVALQTYQSGMRQPMLHFTSFYWMTAMMLLTCSFKSGTYRVFGVAATGEDVFKIVEKYKIAHILTAPILTYKLTNVENPSRYDFSSLIRIACVGTPMALTQLEKMNDLFKNAVTCMGCGMSEIGIVSVFDTEKQAPEFIKKKLTSCGPPAAGISLKIVDIDTEELLPPNQKGEIRLKGPSLMKGYYRADSSQAFDEDGFLKTGDIGYYDEDDCVYVIERIKEMFKYQSWHIVPSSIEAVLLEHPDIKEAAVFGIPAGEDGEAPAAALVLKEGSTLTEQEIDAFLKERVSDRERLRGGVKFMDVLAKTPTGKMARRVIRESVIKSM